MPLHGRGAQEEPQDDGTLDQLRTVENREPGRGAEPKKEDFQGLRLGEKPMAPSTRKRRAEGAVRPKALHIQEDNEDTRFS